VQAAHAQAVADTTLAQKQLLESQRQLAQVRRELDYLKTSSNVEYPPHHEDIPKFIPEGIQKDAQDAGVQADELCSVEELRRQLIVSQQLLELKERNCRVVEKERDDLKATMETEAMTLKDRILLLQLEVDCLKGSHPSPQVDSGHTRPIATPTAADENLRLTAPREQVPQQGEYNISTHLQHFIKHYR
jgi:hypothetical protein